MKPKIQIQFPAINEADIGKSMRKTETVQLRVTQKEKAEIVEAKDLLGLTTSEYLLRCHRVVSEKLRDQ